MKDPYKKIMSVSVMNYIIVILLPIKTKFFFNFKNTKHYFLFINVPQKLNTLKGDKPTVNFVYLCLNVTHILA